MTHSRSYPVTKGANTSQSNDTKGASKHQLDLEYANNNWFSLSGWLPFLIAGALAWSLLVFMIVCGERFFPKMLDPYTDLVLFEQKGYLRVHPLPLDVDNGVESHYSIHLPLLNLNETKTQLIDLLGSYPEKHGNVYKNCWLERPNMSNPCFYDYTWILDVCSPVDSFGYEENNGFYNPCFIIKFNETEDWTPLPVDFVPSYIADQYDHGFMPVHCIAKDSRKSLDVTVYPRKGFSLLYFPVSKFDPKKYLAPLVAVKVNGIQKGQNITVMCSIITPNAFILENNGRAVVHFTSSS